MKNRLLFATVLIGFMSVLLPRPALAASASLVISEVQLQSADSKSEEFVELYNTAASDIEVSDWKVEYLTAANNLSTPPLATLHGKVAAHGFVLLSKTDYLPDADAYFDKGLSEDGGHIALVDASGAEIDRVGWGTAVKPEGSSVPAPDKGLSLRREAHAADPFADTDNNVADFVADLPDPQGDGLLPSDSSPPSDATCQGAQLSEIVANPAGADSAGGEFIELYNPTSAAIPLAGCSLATDKMKTYAFDGDAVLGAQSYYVVALKDKLLNAGGTVTFSSTDGDEVISYPALDDDQAWALIAGTWQLTNQATPGAANILLTADTTAGADATAQTVAPCPSGKYRNPDTNRCKNIDDSSGNLTPCNAGQVRNLDTNRCHATAALASATSLTPCKEGQERNPATNRCRTATTASTVVQPCAAGQERNPATNRCRKATTTPATTSATNKTTTAAKADKINLGIIALAGSGALTYGAYEYRQDLRNVLSKLRTKFIPHANA
ncbi:MAG TPA: lamin tail domain-containing protein [Candidatus Saccharimonadales bacterium]|nr:lamin tail domain-containing protein [Candidatus Saccharimonadales bacterium]